MSTNSKLRFIPFMIFLLGALNVIQIHAQKKENMQLMSYRFWRRRIWYLGAYRCKWH